MIPITETPPRTRRRKITVEAALWQDQIDELWRRARANSRPFAYELRDALERGLALDVLAAEPEQR